MQPWAELGPHVQCAPELKILLAEPSFCPGCCWISWYHRPSVSVRGVEVSSVHQPNSSISVQLNTSQHKSPSAVTPYWAVTQPRIKLHSLQQHLHSSSHRALLSVGRSEWSYRILVFNFMDYFKWNKLKNTLCFAVEGVSCTLLK